VDREVADIAIVVPCSKSKRVGPYQLATAEELLTIKEEVHNHFHESLIPARELYLGRQHRTMVRAVDSLRMARPDLGVQMFIVSAGYGLLSETELVVPYEAHLGTTRAQWIDRGTQLRLHDQLTALRDISLTQVFGLSVAYLEAAKLPSDSLPNAIYLAGAAFARKHTGTFLLAGREQARQSRCAEREVRGLVLSRLLESVALRGLGVLDQVRQGDWHLDECPQRAFNFR
jgi:hypothetical protein